MFFTAWSLHYIITGALNFVALGIMEIILFRNFSKKRTVGTFLLILAYGSVLFNEIFTTTAFIYEGVDKSPIAITISKILNILGVFCLVYTINWMYFFANRHLIKDNDLVKSIYTSIFGAFIGIVGALAIQNIIQDYFLISQGLEEQQQWYSTIPLAGADFNYYLPSIEWPQILIIGLLFVFGSVTYFRIILRTVQLRRKAKDIETKKGLRMVTISIFLLLSTGLVLGAYIFGANRNPSSSSLLYLFRGLIVFGGVFTGYIGWIMPEWARKRWRGTAWLTKVYTGKIPTPKINPSNIENEIEGTASKYIEVNDV